ncbi:molybdenum cofactor guanylyltransferase [Natronomonas sp.]|uniref:molybdenum cofactor guanylyltransferase n=1 Tax=Natronomonas sp. TaxID=2184060 RepID=UPI002FC2DB17
MTNGARTGVIVGGGRSVRFGGTDKTVADLNGKPVIRHTAERLLEATEKLVVNCREDQREAVAEALSDFDLTFAIDEEPDRGPVAGIAEGLRAAETDYAAIAAADMPLLDPDLFAYLFERADGHDAAVPRPGDWFEPLHAVYRPEPMADACTEALQEEDTRIIEPLFSLDYDVVERADLVEHGSLDSFESVDTPEDLAWAAEQL